MPMPRGECRGDVSPTRSGRWTAAGAALSATIVGSGSLIGEPLVFPIRSAVVTVLVVVASCGAAAALATRRWRVAAVLAGCTAFVAWQGARPALDRSAVLGRTDAAARAIERHFVVGYGDPTTARELALRTRVGGLFITRRNVVDRSSGEVSSWVAELQRSRHDAGVAPLVVAADQEGGSVSHLSPPLPKPPALSSLAGLPEATRRAAAERLGAEQGTALRGIGVNLDLAPVSDLMPTASPSVLDRHTRIATRAISDDPGIAADIAAGFSRGLLDAGVGPTAKHFPGLGRVGTDTHLFTASLGTAATDLDRTDWVPFRAVLGLPGTSVMLSHVSLDAVDPGVPASRSKRIVDGILRRAWGFEGIAITDDLTMGAVIHGGLCRAVEGALNAGVDLLLVSWDTDKIYPAIRCALEASDAGRLDPGTMAASARRLDALAAASAGPAITAPGVPMR